MIDNVFKITWKKYNFIYYIKMNNLGTRQNIASISDETRYFTKLNWLVQLLLIRYDSKRAGRVASISFSFSIPVDKDIDELATNQSDVAIIPCQSYVGLGYLVALAMIIPDTCMYSEFFRQCMILNNITSISLTISCTINYTLSDMSKII